MKSTGLLSFVNDTRGNFAACISAISAKHN